MFDGGYVVSNLKIRRVIILVVVMMGGFLLYSIFHSMRSSKVTELPYSDLLNRVNNNGVATAIIEPEKVSGQLTDKTQYSSKFYGELLARDLADQMNKHGVKVSMNSASAVSLWVTMLITFAPFLLIIGFGIFMLRRMQSGSSTVLSFGKSRAKRLLNHQKPITFKDVAGIDEAKEELEEIIEFLNEPQKFQELGGRIPKGVLIMGPPGTGKTLLARAIAGEANVPFFSISGSDFVEMFVGVGASRVRDLFEQGKRNAPCIIFIDEIDAVGRHRGAGLGGGHDEREQTLNQLLVEMDGFESNDGVILIASTNRPDVLDPALLRPGRFDRRIVVHRPDVKGRERILAVHTRKVPLGEDVDVSVIARGTSGFTGADLANLVNEAALNAARYNQKTVTMADFEWAKDKVLMGPERRSAVISEEEKKTTAYHESGHTIVGLKIPNADPIHKVTIIPRGAALGLTQQLPEGDRYMHSLEYIQGSIAILMGGRIAEDVFIGHITTGAANDVERATELAHKMVCEFGMSRLGPLAFGKKEEMIFLGRMITQHRGYSKETAIKIDQEVNHIIMEQYERARRIVIEECEAVERLAQALLECESLNAVQIGRVVAGLPLDDDIPLPITSIDEGKPADKESVLKPIPLPIRGSNPATA
jgi:cell division protease FtsH